MALEPGTRLGHYEITGQIGKGGMGEVYRARDTRLGREVAIKTLPPEFGGSDEHLARFRREARAASALNHPNICTVHDLAEHDGQPFIVMELLEGETLKTRLERGRLAPHEVLDIGAQLASGLEAAHAQGIVHRDIKPANIFVTRHGTVKILDFGLARGGAAVPEAPTIDLGSLTGVGDVLGTVSYMSPEQARGEELDARSDMFSLGVVLYEMTTGHSAFPGKTTAVIIDRLLNHAVDPPSRLAPALPRDLEALISQLLTKDRDRRSTTAHEVGRLLHGIRQPAKPAPAEAPERKSIAVLPFENRSAEPDNDYFSDGLTDEVIADLSQLAGLRVISRNSSMQLKGSGKDLRTLAAQLDVRYVLEGTVRKSGNSVRVTAQLVDPAADEHLWAGKYSGTLEDIFEIQEQISRQIADALKMRLSPEEDRKLAARPIDNVEAFECYQRARAEIYRFTPEGLDRALALVQTALDIVGDNELLYAAMGTIYWQYVNAAIKTDDGYIEKAEECVRQIFALNPESAPGYSLLGSVRQNQGRPAEAAETFKKALSIDPNNLYALGELGRVYQCVGAIAESRAAYTAYVAASPLEPMVRTGLVELDLMSGNMAAVCRDGSRIVQAFPDFPPLRWLVSMGFVHDGQLDEARHILAETAEERIPTIAGHCCRFLRLALEEKPDEARACFNDELLSRARNVEFWSWWVSESYALIDERERAIDWLENAFERGFYPYPYLAEHSTVFRKLDAEPRFQKLLEKVKKAWEAFEP